jgi:hypothetical protein
MCFEGTRLPAYVQFTARLALIGLQLVVAAFYAFYAVLMWGPFMAAPSWAKLVVFTLTFWPALSLFVAARDTRISSIGATSIIALLTGVQLLIVAIVAVAAS